MKQLKGLDATFLYMESPTNFGHVSSLAIYERPEDPGFDPFLAARQMLESQIDRIEPFRRRVVPVPFGIDRPYWIEDPDFDLDYHLRHLAIPSPGTDEQLGAQVARIVGRPCDRSRPLWELYVIEGLESGDFAVLTKLHHATVDGAAGAILTTMLLDDAPDTQLPVPAALPSPDSVPGGGELFLRSLGGLVRQPDRAVRIQLRLAQQFATAARAQGVSELLGSVRRVVTGARRPGPDSDAAPEAPSTSAPRTVLNAMISPHRRVAFQSVSLGRIKEVKSAAGATVNDVVMAACAGGLRTYLSERDELPAEPLVGIVPVSIRTGAEDEPWTNRVSGLFCQLPTHLDDPLERLQFVHGAMVEAKSDWDLLPADAMVDLAQMAPPALAERAARVMAAFRLTDRVNLPMNVTISNVPGPREPLYLRGARMKHYIPISTVTDGCALNITVQSYVDTLDFGLIADRDIVPDLWDLCHLCVDEIEVLAAAAGL
jgi:diacylglycerol O-acyltransferase